MAFDSSHGNRVVCIMLTGKTEDGRDDFIYIAINAHWENHRIIYHHFHMIRLAANYQYRI